MFPAAGCGGPVVSDLPATGRLRVEVHIEPETLGLYSQFSATWAAQLISGAAAGGVESSFDTRDISAAEIQAQDDVLKFNESQDLRAGQWQISILVLGLTGTAAVLDTLCYQQVLQDKTVVVTFREDTISCTSPLGGKLPPG
jgi:hypothetical protein